MEGKVVRIVAEKRFGFIKGEDEKDYFFHQADMSGFWEDLVQDIEKGREIKVTFISVPSTKGPRAAGVSRLDSGV